MARKCIFSFADMDIIMRELREQADVPTGRETKSTRAAGLADDYITNCLVHRHLRRPVPYELRYSGEERRKVEG